MKYAKGETLNCQIFSANKLKHKGQVSVTEKVELSPITLNKTDLFMIIENNSMHVIAKGKGRNFGIEYLSLRLAPSYAA